MSLTASNLAYVASPQRLSALHSIISTASECEEPKEMRSGYLFWRYHVTSLSVMLFIMASVEELRLGVLLLRKPSRSLVLSLIPPAMSS